MAQKRRFYGRLMSDFIGRLIEPSAPRYTKTHIFPVWGDIRMSIVLPYTLHINNRNCHCPPEPGRAQITYKGEYKRVLEQDRGHSLCSTALQKGWSRPQYFGRLPVLTRYMSLIGSSLPSLPILKPLTAIGWGRQIVRCPAREPLIRHFTDLIEVEGNESYPRPAPLGLVWDSVTRC
jgi:hypothetical protein